MITINLSDEQAAELYSSIVCDDGLPKDVAKEIFTQLGNKQKSAPTNAAEVAAWRCEAGLTNKVIENWKRKNESLEVSGL